jgi:hypothetical protein
MLLAVASSIALSLAKAKEKKITGEAEPKANATRKMV